MRTLVRRSNVRRAAYKGKRYEARCLPDGTLAFDDERTFATLSAGRSRTSSPVAIARMLTAVLRVTKQPPTIRTPHGFRPGTYRLAVTVLVGHRRLTLIDRVLNLA